MWVSAAFQIVAGRWRCLVDLRTPLGSRSGVLALWLDFSRASSSGTARSAKVQLRKDVKRTLFCKICLAWPCVWVTRRPKELNARVMVARGPWSQGTVFALASRSATTMATTMTTPAHSISDGEEGGHEVARREKPDHHVDGRLVAEDQWEMLAPESQEFVRAQGKAKRQREKRARRAEKKKDKNDKKDKEDKRDQKDTAVQHEVHDDDDDDDNDQVYDSTVASSGGGFQWPRDVGGGDAQSSRVPAMRGSVAAQTVADSNRHFTTSKAKAKKRPRRVAARMGP